jgi:hypothetical protein
MEQCHGGADIKRNEEKGKSGSGARSEPTRAPQEQLGRQSAELITPEEMTPVVMTPVVMTPVMKTLKALFRT